MHWAAASAADERLGARRRFFMRQRRLSVCRCNGPGDVSLNGAGRDSAGRIAEMHDLMQTDTQIDEESSMRTTLTIDDELFAKAVALAEPGIERSELIKECVKAFIQRQTARRLAALGGQAPDIELAPRRREEVPVS